VQRHRMSTSGVVCFQKSARKGHLWAFFKTQLLLLFLAILVAELVLHMFGGLALKRILAPPWERDAPVIADEQMIARGNRLRLDADEKGYRNPTRPRVADVVALGDSQTFGPEDFRNSWPALLSKRTGQSVYNMGLPEYGPLQYLLQLDEALSFNPKLIIVAPYFGNDFYDAFTLFRRHPELAKSMPPALVNEALEMDHRRPIQGDIEALSGLADDPLADKPVTPFRRWLSVNSRIYALLRAIKNRIDPLPISPLLAPNLDTAATGLTPEKLRSISPFRGSDWKTILTAPYRNRVLTDTDARIRLGFELSVYAVDQIAKRCRAAGTDLLVVLLPTKENVFFPRVALPDSYRELEALAANEDRLKREWIADLTRQGISYIDVLDPLRRAVRQPYPENLDGHPNPEGYAIIAREIATKIALSKHEPTSLHTSSVFGSEP